MAPDVDLREVRRYLGWKGREPDPALEALIGEAVRDLRDAVEPKHVVRLFPLALSGEDTVEVEGLRLRSRALARSLRDCPEVYLMAATLGLAPDRLIARAQASGRIARAMALQAAGAAMIEAVCDDIDRQLCGKEAAAGRSLRPRFSPGYGDLPLDCQEGLFRVLDVQKRIGVTLTESLLMVPTKSVTAFIGVSAVPRAAGRGCGICGKRDCAYRVHKEEDET